MERSINCWYQEHSCLDAELKLKLNLEAAAKGRSQKVIWYKKTNQSVLCLHISILTNITISPFTIFSPGTSTPSPTHSQHFHHGYQYPYPPNDYQLQNIPPYLPTPPQKQHLTHRYHWSLPTAIFPFALPSFTTPLNPMNKGKLNVYIHVGCRYEKTEFILFKKVGMVPVCVPWIEKWKVLCKI